LLASCDSFFWPFFNSLPAEAAKYWRLHGAPWSCGCELIVAILHDAGDHQFVLCLAAVWCYFFGQGLTSGYTKSATPNTKRWTMLGHACLGSTPYAPEEKHPRTWCNCKIL
jgi:hypothetical protein